MSTNSIPQLDTGVTSRDALRPMLRALDAAERALFGTPASPIISLCEARECTTFADACMVAATDEDEGRYTVPAQCRICGGWFVIPDPDVQPSEVTK